jgi:hypothetical protein
LGQPLEPAAEGVRVPTTGKNGWQNAANKIHLVSRQAGHSGALYDELFEVGGSPEKRFVSFFRVHYHVL